MLSFFASLVYPKSQSSNENDRFLAGDICPSTTASSHSDLLPFSQQPMDRSKSPSYVFFPDNPSFIATLISFILIISVLTIHETFVSVVMER